MPRDRNHDYRSVCIYHITITKATGIPDFSVLIGEPESVIVKRNIIGMIIENNIRNFRHIHPDIHTYQYVIMPDHVHFILHVKNYLDKSIGSYIGVFKARIRQQLRTEAHQDIRIFEEDFYDRILRPTHSLQTIFNYIRSNPYRLAIRRKHPDFFRRTYGYKISGRSWQLYGNTFLLRNPFKEQVVIHRADSDNNRRVNRYRWLHTAANGGVIVSPFIAREEKDIRTEAEALNGKIILITNEPFGVRYKPSAHDFSLCEQGNLLIIAPNDPLPAGRETFLYLNSIAAMIASGKC